MLRFIIRRTIIGAGVLLVASLLMYLMVDLAIDPLQDLRTRTAANKAILIKPRIGQLNLNQPAIVRYFDWLRHFVTGDMGTAWTTGRPVKDIVASAIVSTIQLITASTFLAIVLGIGVGRSEERRVGEECRCRLVQGE